jgi:hypothetical protein
VKKKMRCSLALFVAVLLLSACANNTAQEQAAPDLPDDLDAYLKQTEARFTDLRPNNEKLIVWADPSKKAKTPSQSSICTVSRPAGWKSLLCATSLPVILGPIFSIPV